MSELIQLEDLQPEALGEVIRARAGEFDKATMRAVEHAWHAGRALLAAKKIIPHGQWGQWLSDNFEGRSHDTARIWMRLAANYESVRNLEDVKHGIKLLDEAPDVHIAGVRIRPEGMTLPEVDSIGHKQN